MRLLGFFLIGADAAIVGVGAFLGLALLPTDARLPGLLITGAAMLLGGNLGILGAIVVWVASMKKAPDPDLDERRRAREIACAASFYVPGLGQLAQGRHGEAFRFFAIAACAGLPTLGLGWIATGAFASQDAFEFDPSHARKNGDGYLATWRSPADEEEQVLPSPPPPGKAKSPAENPLEFLQK